LLDELLVGELDLGGGQGFLGVALGENVIKHGAVYQISAFRGRVDGEIRLCATEQGRVLHAG